MKNISFLFNQSRVVVTGGASGIGLGVCQRFLEAGAQVAVWDFSQDSIDGAKSQLLEFGNQVIFSLVNVADRGSVERAVAHLPWSPSVLINNAGITRDKSFAKLSSEDWDAVIQVNLTGIYNVTRGLLEKFDDQSGHRRIINISSVVGVYGNFGQANYAAAKAGVIGFTKTLAKELGRKKFTVNAIAPGFIKTAMTQAMPLEVLSQMSAKVPAQRLGEVDDIASACLFLASSESSYINGSVLNVDGGIVL